MKIKVKFVFDTGQSFTADLDSNLCPVKYFSIYEMANKLAMEPVKLVINSKFMLFAKMMEEFRIWYAKPMTINSWYRTASFNASVHGDPNSGHKEGICADWGISGHTEQQRANVKKKWMQLCAAHGVIGAINFYTNGYHFEIYSDLLYGAKSFQIRDYRGTKNDW